MTSKPDAPAQWVHHSRVTWQGGACFAAEQDGHAFLLDAAPDLGGKGHGPTPKALLLTALIGCTAMDVGSTLQKMRVPLSGFTVEAMGKTAATHPRRYTTVGICYAFEGPSTLSTARIVRAVQLSFTRYCGIIETLRPSVQMDVEIQINGQRIDAAVG